MRNVTRSDDQLLQFAHLANGLHVLVHVRVGGQNVAFNVTLVGSAQNAEATILAPPLAPGVDGNLRG